MANSETYRLLFQTQTQGVESLSQVERILGGITTSGNSAASSLTSVETALTAIGGKAGVLIGIGTAAAAAVGVLGNLAVQTAKLAEEQNNVAIRTGLTIREVGQFSQLAQNAGVNAGALTTSMKTLSRALSENTDEGQQAKNALRQYGVELTNVYGAALPTREIFIRLGETLGKIEDPAERANLAIKVLGRGGLELLPALTANAREAVSEMEKLGVGFTESGARAALELDSALDKLNTNFSVLKTRVGEALAELINPALRILLAPTPDRRTPISIPALSQGNVPPNDFFPFSTNPPAAGGADFEAATRAGNRQSINLILANRGTRVEQLTRALQIAEADLAQAIRGTDAASVAATRSGVARVDSLKAQIQAAKELAALNERLGTFVARESDRRNPPRVGPSLIRPGENPNLVIGNTGFFVSPTSERLTVGGSDGTFGPGFIESARIRDQLAEDSRQRELAFRERIIELQSGPGGELATAQQIYNLRIGAAQTQAEIEQANYELSLRTLEIMKQRENTLRSTGQDFTRSLLSGQGISGFLRNQGSNILSTIGGNAAVQLFSGTRLSLTQNPNSTLGRLLAGTPFGADPLAGATNTNTIATQQNTMALSSLNATLAAGTIGGFGGSGGTGGILGLPGRIFGGAGTNPFIFSNNASNAANIAIGKEGLDYLGSVGIGSGSTATPGSFKETLGKAAFYGAAVAGGTFGAISGFREGGARGTTNAIASILGAAAAIPGPQQPFIAAGALAAGLIGGLLPNRRRSRENEIQSMLAAAEFSGPASTQYDIGTGGGSYDFDFRGNRRAVPVQIVIQALDAKSINDHSGEIADAVRIAINGGHPINDTMRKEVLAQ